VAFQCHQAWAAVRIKDQGQHVRFAVWDLTRLCWTTPQPEARQAKVIWEPTWLVGMPGHLLGLPV